MQKDGMGIRIVWLAPLGVEEMLVLACLATIYHEGITGNPDNTADGYIVHGGGLMLTSCSA